MTFTTLYHSLPVNGWLSEPEARLLWESAQRTTGAILEVGAYYGRSSLLLASLKRPLYCVDPFAGFDDGDLSGDRIEARWRANLAPYPNAMLFRCRIEDWQQRPVGFAYLDGDHSYQGTLFQIGMALACGAKVIAVHDISDGSDGLEIQRACVGLLGQWRERAERLAVWEVGR